MPPTSPGQRTRCQAGCNAGRSTPLPEPPREPRVHPQDRPDCRPHQEPPQAECQWDRIPAKSSLPQLLAEADRAPDQALPHVETAVRFNQGQDLSQIEERHPLGGFHNGAGEIFQRLPNSGRTGRTGDAFNSKDVDTSGQGGQSELSRGGILPTVQWTEGRGTRGVTKAQGTGKQGPGPTGPRTGQEG